METEQILNRILIDCRTTKPKVITAANQYKGKYHKQPIRIQSKVGANYRKRGKTRVTKSRLVLFYFWLVESVVRVFCTNHKANEKQNQCIRR